MLATLDIALRGASLSLLLLFCVHLLRTLPFNRKVFACCISNVFIGIHLIEVSPNTRIFFGDIPVAVSLLLTIDSLLLVWACMEFFFDKCRIYWYHYAFAAAYLLAAIIVPAVGLPPNSIAIFMPIVWGYLIYVVLRSERGDLVESRRRFRKWFCIEVAVVGLIITYCAFVWPIGEAPAFWYPLIAGMCLVLLFSLVLWVLKVGDEVLEFDRKGHAAPDPVTAGSLSLAENALAVRLDAAMTEGVWRQEGLTIRVLAGKLDAPEHRLRKVINQGLGYRNFAAFVNERRVAAAASAFSDPQRAEVPVITIAHESGFASLGPFNRAFREITGFNPTDYRKRAANFVQPAE